MASTESHADHSKTIDTLGLPGQMPRKLNITMIGAGSFFTNSVLKDVILIPGHKGGELRLIDVDATRLALAEQLMEKIVDEADQRQQLKLVHQPGAPGRLAPHQHIAQPLRHE